MIPNYVIIYLYIYIDRYSVSIKYAGYQIDSDDALKSVSVADEFTCVFYKQNDQSYISQEETASVPPKLLVLFAFLTQIRCRFSWDDFAINYLRLVSFQTVTTCCHLEKANLQQSLQSCFNSIRIET